MEEISMIKKELYKLYIANLEPLDEKPEWVVAQFIDQPMIFGKGAPRPNPENGTFVWMGYHYSRALLWKHVMEIEDAPEEALKMALKNIFAHNKRRLQ
jgi:hypothetical protein